VYAKKLGDISASSRRRTEVMRAVKVLEARMQRLHQLQWFRLWVTFQIHVKAKRRRNHLADALESFAHRQIAVRAFVDWRCVASSCRATKTQGDVMLHHSREGNRVILQHFWAQWLNFAATQRFRSERSAAAEALAQASRRSLLRRFATLWGIFVVEKQTYRTQLHHTETRAVVAELRRHIATMDHLLQRRKLLDDADIAIQKAEGDRDQQWKKLAEAKSQCEKLRSQVDARRLDRYEAVRATLQQQVSDLISGLKCKVTNFYDDFTLVQRVAEKQRKVGPEKVFLESHQTVKRVVVELTHESHLSADQVWPLTMPLIRSMRSHHTEAVLAAIKGMIISYDSLTSEQQASLTTDEELVVNVENLQNMADFCLEVRNKRRRGVRL